MIQNQRQYKVTGGQIAKLQGALAASRRAKGRMHPRVYEAMIAGIEGEIEKLRAQLREFEELQQARVLRLGSAEELGRILIKGRVARGYTQKDLADAVKLKPQQIQKYEATEYRSASLKRVLEVMRALEVDIDTEIHLKPAAPGAKRRRRGGSPARKTSRRRATGASR